MKQKKCEWSMESSSKRLKQACHAAPRFSKAARLSMQCSSASSSSSSSSSNSIITSEEECGGISSPCSDDVVASDQLKRTDDSLQSAPLLNIFQMSSPCIEKKRRRCNPWMRFCMFFPLLQRKLPSSSVASLQLVWNDFKAHKITRGELIASFRRIAGDQILAESIKILQFLQSQDTENSDSSS